MASNIIFYVFKRLFIEKLLLYAFKQKWSFEITQTENMEKVKMFMCLL